MSVIVMGMEMPHKCLECRLNTDEIACTAATLEQSKEAYYEAKKNGTSHEEEMFKTCPLRPLPENHGRLLDENEIREAFGMGKDCALCKQDIRDCQYNPIFTRMEFCGAIDDMKTIIVAEGET